MRGKVIGRSSHPAAATDLGKEFVAGEEQRELLDGWRIPSKMPALGPEETAGRGLSSGLRTVHRGIIGISRHGYQLFISFPHAFAREISRPESGGVTGGSRGTGLETRSTVGGSAHVAMLESPPLHGLEMDNLSLRLPSPSDSPPNAASQRPPTAGRRGIPPLKFREEGVQSAVSDLRRAPLPLSYSLRRFAGVTCPLTPVSIAPQA